MGEINYTPVYDPRVLNEDLPGIPKTVHLRIKKAIESRLLTHPEVYGKPLHSSLKNNRKLRVGDYRIIYRIQKNKVIIWAIGHRSVIYAIALKRLLGGLQYTAF